MNKREEINIPNEVIAFKLQASFGFGVGVSHYEEMITKYPEHFKDEIEYRKKWDSVPQEVKDEYFNNHYKLTYDKTHPELGDIPYPELVGGGIIQRTKHFGEKNHHEMEAKYYANETWQAKLSVIREREDIALYNKLFNKYGLKK